MHFDSIVIQAPPPKDRRLTTDDRWDIGKFSLQIVWAVVFGLFTIPTYLDLGLSFAMSIIWASLVIFGSGLSIVGRVTFAHLTTELTGAFVTLGGWVLYLLAQVIATLNEGVTTRLGLAVLICLAGYSTLRRFVHLGKKFLARFGIGTDGVVLPRKYHTEKRES